MPNNNIDMASLMQMLSKMDKQELEGGIAKANQILQSQDKNNISPDMVNNIMDMLNKNSNGNINTANNNANNDNSSNNTTSSNLDLDTILRMKSIIDKMNVKDDPRSKLLESLKPYLKESRRNKIDQYVGLMNMSKVMESFNLFNGDNKNASN